MRNILKQVQFFLENAAPKDKLLHSVIGSVLTLLALCLYFKISWLPMAIVAVLPFAVSVAKELVWLWLFRVRYSWADVVWSSWNGVLMYLVWLIWA